MFLRLNLRWPGVYTDESRSAAHGLPEGTPEQADLHATSQLEPAQQLTAFPQPAAPRYESLTMWRGVACLFVVIFHSAWIGYGLSFPKGPGPLRPILAVVHRLWIGVPLFFVISGYCVTASADAARRQRASGAKFFRRRFRRIYPPYWVWLGIVAVAVWWVEHSSRGFFEAIYIPNPKGFTVWQWLGNITLTESWRWHFTGGVENQLLAPSWTLCYEEQFYALVGLALIFSRKFFFHTLGLITVAVIAGMLMLPSLGINARGTFLDGKWLMFAAVLLRGDVLQPVPHPLASGYDRKLGI